MSVESAPQLLSAEQTEDARTRRRRERRERKAIRESQVSFLPNSPIDLRFGRHQKVLRDVQADTAIYDAPYSARTHAGRRTGSDVHKSTIDYLPITAKMTHAFARRWNDRIREWIICFGDIHTWEMWCEAWDKVGRYVFRYPVVWYKPDAAPLMCGAGPNSACEFICVARAKRWPDVMGSRPGHYNIPTSSTRGNNKEHTIPGQKPLELMRAIVRDYTKKGDLIVDQFAGMGTTLLAAAMEGRRAVGAEKSRKTFGFAKRRMLTGFTQTFDAVLDEPSPGLITLPLCTCPTVVLADDDHEKDCMRAQAARALEAA